MKKLRYILVLAFVLLQVSSCDKMDDNYSHYLDEEKIYPPKVTNLIAYEGLREVSLAWDNPEGNIATKIFIEYGEDSLLYERMVDSVFIDGLEIKGYTVSVYTLDSYDNRSVPETVTIFPNGEN